jgi:hypothetical protein
VVTATNLVVRFEHVRTFAKPYTYADSCFVCTVTDEHERTLCGFDSRKDLYDNYYKSTAQGTEFSEFYDSSDLDDMENGYNGHSFVAELRAKGLLSYDEEEDGKTNGKQQLTVL